MGLQLYLAGPNVGFAHFTLEDIAHLGKEVPGNGPSMERCESEDMSLGKRMSCYMRIYAELSNHSTARDNKRTTKSTILVASRPTRNCISLTLAE